jgi:hypothetical protein
VSYWSQILTRAEVREFLMQHVELSPRTIAANCETWLGRDARQLRSAQNAAWLCNDGESFMLARSLLADLTRSAA